MAYCRTEAFLVRCRVDAFYYDCLACPLSEDGRGTAMFSPEEAIRHLEAHRAAGHDIPDSAFERLNADAARASSPTP